MGVVNIAPRQDHSRDIVSSAAPKLDSFRSERDHEVLAQSLSGGPDRLQGIDECRGALRHEDNGVGSNRLGRSQLGTLRYGRAPENQCNQRSKRHQRDSAGL